MQTAVFKSYTSTIRHNHATNVSNVNIYIYIFIYLDCFIYIYICVLKISYHVSRLDFQSEQCQTGSELRSNSTQLPQKSNNSADLVRQGPQAFWWTTEGIHDHTKGFKSGRYKLNDIFEAILFTSNIVDSKSKLYNLNCHRVYTYIYIHIHQTIFINIYIYKYIIIYIYTRVLISIQM